MAGAGRNVMAWGGLVVYGQALRSDGPGGQSRHLSLGRTPQALGADDLDTRVAFTTSKAGADRNPHDGHHYPDPIRDLADPVHHQGPLSQGTVRAVRDVTARTP